MSPRDVPGQLQINSLFPWLAQLTPTTETSRPAAPPAPLAPLAPRQAPADLPRAA